MSTLADAFMAAAARRDLPAVIHKDFAYVAMKIAGAQRFVVSSDARGAIRSLLTSKPSTLLAAAKYARLPFDRCWLEWTPPGTSALHPGQIACDRCGAYMERYGEHGFTIFTAWHFDKAAYWRTVITETPEMRHVFDDLPLLNLSAIVGAYDFSGFDGPPLMMTPARPDPAERWMQAKPISAEKHALEMARNDERNGIRYAINDRAELDALIKIDSRAAFRLHREARGEYRMNEQSALGQASSALHDVQDEMGHLFATLILMNAKNCVELAPFEPPEKLNKARRKAGKVELLPYSTVHIELNQAQERAVARGEISREEARRHLVRGHFKVRRTGVFWWSDFTRGNALRGFVDRKEHVLGGHEDQHDAR